MEQTWNKGRTPNWLCDVNGRENSREFERGGKEGNALTESIQTKLDAKLKKAFTSSFRRANAGFIAWCILMLNSVICLGLWRMAGIRWVSLIGASLFFLAIGSIFLAFTAQSVNQVVRIVVRVKGKDKDFFRKEEKECCLSKTVTGYCRFVKRAFKRNDATHGYNRYEAKCSHNLYGRDNSRSYRHVSRPAFAHASSDGGGGNDDSSGDSDSGDEPPKPSLHLTFSKRSSKKLNGFSRPWRFLCRPGCWRLPCCKYAVRRRPAWR